MKKIVFCLILALLCGKVLEAGEKKSARTIREVKKKIEQPGNKFALDIYKRIAEGKKGNIIFSPFSLYESLSMLNLGADGETEKQISKTLYIPKNQEKFYAEALGLHKKLLSLNRDGISLLVANALFADASQNISPEYQKELKKYYAAKMFSLDFRKDPGNSCAKLNKWVSEKTKGRIKGILNPETVPDLVCLYLVNAVYFKGYWASQFKKRDTVKGEFTCLDGKKVQVPTMYQQEEFYYSENDEMQFLGMRYLGKTVSMGIILPRKREDFSAYEKNLDIKKLQDILTSANSRSVKVFLPKFKFQSDMSLIEPLKKTGMEKAFDRINAEFPKVGDTRVYVSRVLQRAEIEVNETGAVATAVTMVEECFGDDTSYNPKVFRANRPFLFFIQDKSTKTLLFLGRVTKP